MQTKLRVDTGKRIDHVYICYGRSAQTATDEASLPTWNGDWILHFHNDISCAGKPNVGWCFILTATPPRGSTTPLCYTRSGAGGPVPRLSGLQTRSRAALGFLKSRPEQVYAPANRPAAPLRTLLLGTVMYGF